MPWLDHPQYVSVRERLIGYLQSPQYRFRRLAPVLFLCGGAVDSPRDTVRDYLRRRRHDLRLFYAERVWEHIAATGGRSALEMEADLASLADLVIIVVESPGTFAELGAFSLSDPLRVKLLPLVDKKYADAESFIANGPLMWIDRESQFAPTIYVSLCRILEVIDQIEERISRIPKSKSFRVEDLAQSPKHLLFFLCDLVAVIYPATANMIEYYIRKISPSISSSAINVPTLLGLAVAMNLMKTNVSSLGSSSETFFFPAAIDAVERPFHHRPFLDLPTQRAEHVSVLLAIPEAKIALDSLGESF